MHRHIKLLTFLALAVTANAQAALTAAPVHAAVTAATPSVSPRALSRGEVDFLKKVAAEAGKLTLRTAAFSFGTGGQHSAPAKRGYIAHHGSGDDAHITISITEAGEAFLRAQP